MTNLEYARKKFENHIATFQDLDSIKILDFKNPNSNDYRIRFLFEEDYYRLHISGDLGHLVATNYNNMCFDEFRDFVHNTGYFESKINCCDRPIYEYDYNKAMADLKEALPDPDFFFDAGLYDSGEERRDELIDDIIEDLNPRTGLGSTAYNLISEFDPDCFEWISDIGKVETNILEIYMLAFELAVKQIDPNYFD